MRRYLTGETLAIFFLSFLILTYFAAPFADVIDEFHYLGEIISHRWHSVLGLGRFPFVATYTLFYDLLSRFFPQLINPFSAYTYLRFLSIFLTSITICVFYLLVKKLFKSQLVALLSLLLLFSQYSFLRYGSKLLTEPMMWFLFITGLFLFIEWMDEQDDKFLFLSTICFSLCFLIREQLILLLLVLTTFVVFLSKKDHLFRRISLFLGMLGGGIAFWLALQAAIFRQEYLDNILHFFGRISAYFPREISFAKLQILWVEKPVGARVWLFLLAFLGLVIISKRKISGMNTRKKLFLFLSFLALLPPQFLVLYTYQEQRFFIVFLFLLTPLAGYFINHIIELTKNKFLVMILLIWIGICIVPIMEKAKNEGNKWIQLRKEYGLTLFNHVPDKALLLAGMETWQLYRFYQIGGIRPQWEIIPSGGEWPGADGVRNLILGAISKDIPAYIDTARYSFQNEQQDLSLILQEFKLKTEIDKSNHFPIRLYRITK